MDAYVNGLDEITGGWARHGRPGGLNHAQYGGQGRMGLGLGSPYSSVEPSGDAGEGVDLPATIRGTASAGRGDSYTPVPGVLPTKDHLDYIQKLSTAGLLTIGFVLLIVIGVIHPARAARLVTAGAKRQAGMA